MSFTQLEAGCGVVELTFDPRDSVGLFATSPGFDRLQHLAQLDSPDPGVVLHQPQEAGRDPVAPLHQLMKELRSLSEWDDDSPAPNSLAVGLAERALVIAADLDFLPSRLRPSPEGGVLLAFQVQGRYGKLEIFNEGEIYAALSGFAGETPKAWAISNDSSDVADAIATIQAHVS